MNQSSAGIGPGEPGYGAWFAFWVLTSIATVHATISALANLEREPAPVRRELGVKTLFNILGPLTNPARPQAQAIGCADARMAPVMAGVLAERVPSLADDTIAADGMSVTWTLKQDVTWHDGEPFTAAADRSG